MIGRRIKRSEHGSATVEMALTLPILLVMIYGIFQIGAIMAANAGMQHALGEGARYATIYPTPADNLIKARVQAKIFGTRVGSFTVSDPTTGYDSTGKIALTKTLAVTYTVTPNFLFFSSPSITLNRSKVVYLSF